MQFVIRSKGQAVRFKGRRDQVGLAALTYYWGYNGLLNWAKTAVDDWIIVHGTSTYAQDTIGALLDANGELPVPCNASITSIWTVFYKTPSYPPYPNAIVGEKWIVEWTGQSVCTIGAAITTYPAEETANKKVFSFSSQPDGGAVITLTVPNNTNPPRGIKIYQQRYAANFAAGEKWNPDYLDQFGQVGRFATARFMDVMQTNFQETVINWADQATENHYVYNCVAGPIRGFPTTLICDFANRTGCNVHVNVPHRATDAYVTTFLTTLRDGITDPNVKIIIEYSNETWNFAFGQAQYLWNELGVSVYGSGDGARGFKVSGYRSAQIMRIARTVFGTNSGAGRWIGTLGIQQSAGNLAAMTDGAEDAIATFGSPDNALALTDLFSVVLMTNYFGGAFDFQVINVTNVTNAAQAVVTTDGNHSFVVGQSVIFCLQPPYGIASLHMQKATVVAVPSPNTFQINRNTTGDAAYTLQDLYSSYVSPSGPFDLIDASIARGPAGTNEFPTQYGYFEEQTAQALVYGVCSSGLHVDPEYNIETRQNLPESTPDSYRSLVAAVTALGLEVWNYEGGTAKMAGTPFAANEGRNDLGAVLVSWVNATTHTPRMASVYSKNYSVFDELGIKQHSKFQGDSPPTPHGPWGMIRSFPTTAYPNGDIGSPQHKAVLAANFIKYGPGFVWPCAPFIIGTMAYSGLQIVGQTLTSGGVSIKGGPVPTVSYQWQRDTAGNGTPVALTGEVAASTVLPSAAGSNRVRLVVTATSPGYPTATYTGPWSGIINPTALVNLLTPTSAWDGSSTTGWYGLDVLTASGGEFVITGGGFGFPSAGREVFGLLTIGAHYRLVITGRLGTATAAHNPTARIQEGGSSEQISWTETVPTPKIIDFTATGTKFNLTMFGNNAFVPTGATMMFDDIKLYQLP